MSDIKNKLEYYRIEWDGPIIFVKDDSVTILSPFQILQRIENASLKVRTSVYNAFGALSSREEMLSLLDRLGNKLLAIKL